MWNLIPSQKKFLTKLFVLNFFVFFILVTPCIVFLFEKKYLIILLRILPLLFVSLWILYVPCMHLSMNNVLCLYLLFHVMFYLFNIINFYALLNFLRYTDAKTLLFHRKLFFMNFFFRILVSNWYARNPYAHTTIP